MRQSGSYFSNECKDDALKCGRITDFIRGAETQVKISFKAGKARAVEFIESYLVTTVHPEGDMHHIDDKEWQSVKQRLLR